MPFSNLNQGPMTRERILVSLTSGKKLLVITAKYKHSWNIPITWICRLPTQLIFRQSTMPNGQPRTHDHSPTGVTLNVLDSKRPWQLLHSPGVHIISRTLQVLYECPSQAHSILLQFRRTRKLITVCHFYGLINFEHLLKLLALMDSKLSLYHYST